MQAREGDLIRTNSQRGFRRKRHSTPPRQNYCVPTLHPSTQKAHRKGNNTTYGKVYSLGERFAYLQKNHPELIVFDPVFGETLCEVPIDQIATGLSSEREACAASMTQKAATHSKKKHTGWQLRSRKKRASHGAQLAYQARLWQA